MEDIERVELLRGPQSGLYGANAHSGVLTIITKSGRGLTKPEFNARFEGGTQNSAEAAATFRGAVGPVYGSITATTRPQTASTSRATATRRDGAKRTAVTAKAGVDLTPNFNVEGFLRHSRRLAAVRPAGPQLPQHRAGRGRAPAISPRSTTPWRASKAR